MMASSVRRTVGSEEVTEPVAFIKCEAEEAMVGLNDDIGAMSAAVALGLKSATNTTFGNSTDILDCVVCGDRATGKHYGAVSCDGCKGFFRRSVRKSPIYECRHQNNCTIDKDKRNQCRHCRWIKCIRMGMKKDAVQKERDRLGKQRAHAYNNPVANIKLKSSPSDDHDVDEDDLSVMALLKAEKTAQEYIFRQNRLTRQPSDVERVQATLETIAISMNYQLRSLIEWAKDIKDFVALPDNDKIALLRGHTGENLILGVACRSLNCDDFLLLGNHYIIPRNACDPGLSRAAGRILDEIVKPLKDIQLDENEYACLKAIVFFDNDNKSLSNPTRVKQLRNRVQVNLETYINHQRPLMRGRFGEMLLLLPPLQNIARLMVDLVARYNHDTIHVDDLINEMLLNRYRDDCQEAVISTTTNTNRLHGNTTSSSPSNSISKENDFDSNASSIDTDIEDSLPMESDRFDPLPKPVLASNSVLIAQRTVDDELNSISLNENEDCTPSNPSHMHLLHSNITTDPNLYRHHRTITNNNRVATTHDQYQQVQPPLPYFVDSSNERIKLSKSKSIVTPSPSNSSAGTNFDPNNDITFLYDLVTPPRTIQAIPQLTNDDNAFFDDTWNE